LSLDAEHVCVVEAKGSGSPYTLLCQRLLQRQIVGERLPGKYFRPQRPGIFWVALDVASQQGTPENSSAAQFAAMLGSLARIVEQLRSNITEDDGLREHLGANDRHRLNRHREQ
jgi:hypothetical protein